MEGTDPDPFRYNNDNVCEAVSDNFGRQSRYSSDTGRGVITGSIRTDWKKKDVFVPFLQAR
jgi:hypothetical protein